MLGINLKDVDGNYVRPKAGGHVIRITKATNNPEKERIEFEYDFAEGELEGYYTDLEERAGFWGGKFNKSYKEKARTFLKAFIENVIKSNSDTDGIIVVNGDEEDVDETKLVGKVIGLVAGEEEYVGNDGKIKKRLDVFNAKFVPVEDIHTGNYKVPEFKPITEQKSSGSAQVVDTTLGEIPQEFQASADDTPF